MIISVVICTHERYRVCAEAIDSVKKQDIAICDFELIVVDNSNDQAIAEEFAHRHRSGNTRFIYTPIAGLSHARNIGLKAAEGNIVAYLDDDAVADPLWLHKLIRAFESCGPRTGVVGGPVRPIWTAPTPGWFNEGFFDILSIVDLGTVLRPLKEGEWLAGCNIAFSKASLTAAGGFNPGLGRSAKSLLSNEESELCTIIKKLGKEIVYAPEALVHHSIPSNRTTVEYVRRRVAWQAVSDAIAFPDRSIAQAKSNLRGWRPIARVVKAFRFYRLLGQHCTSMSRQDYDFIYELMNQLLYRA